MKIKKTYLPFTIILAILLFSCSDDGTSIQEERSGFDPDGNLYIEDLAVSKNLQQIDPPSEDEDYTGTGNDDSALNPLRFLTNKKRKESGKPKIIIEPGRIVKTGDEVFFNAANAYKDINPEQCRFEWDFGDGYYLKNNGGITVTHYYKRPGKYRIRLKVTGEKGRSRYLTSMITVSGRHNKLPPIISLSPILELEFENSLSDSSGNDLKVVWDGGRSPNYRCFAGGAEGKGVYLSGGRSIKVLDPEGRLNGFNEFTISFWAKRGRYNSKGYLLQKYNSDSDLIVYDLLIAKPGVLKAHYTMDRDKTGLLTGGESKIGQEIIPAWHHYAMTYDGKRIRIYIDGEQIDSDYPSGNLIFSDDPLYIGRSHLNSEVFNGYIDELKIYDKSLTEEELFLGFELWHADFHGHTAQYIYAQIPELIRADTTNSIYAFIKGNNGYTDILLEKYNLEPEERFLLKNSALPAGDYTLTVRLIDPVNTIIDEITENFRKPYDGFPITGIDENNSLRYNGELFFPVTPWCLNDNEVAFWGNNEYINVLYGAGLAPGQGSYEEWIRYLNVAENNSFNVIGPLLWDKGVSNDFERNADIYNLINFINISKNHNSILMWQWNDEPNLGSEDCYLPATVLRSWTFKSHQLDPLHLVATNFVGSHWVKNSSWHINRRGEYEFLFNKKHFGKRTGVADVYGIYYHPFEYASPHSLGASLESLALAIDRLQEETYGLVPFMSFIETTDIDHPDGDNKRPTPWAPTPDQLRTIIWLNVVHGSKGINWYHYNSATPPENFLVMKEFVRQITALTPVVLGPDCNRELSVRINGNARIDTMLREYKGILYIFAVRLTEIDDKGASIGEKVDATFRIEGVKNGTIDVFDKSKKIIIEGGLFKDSFNVNDVNIYVMPE